MKVGWPTQLAIWADRLVPGAADRYLARTGFEAQQTDTLASPDRKDNLWRPLPGDHGAHGRFDARARGFSVQASMNTRGRRVTVVSSAAALAIVLLSRRVAKRRLQAGRLVAKAVRHVSS